MGPFPIKMFQKSDQDPVIRGGKLNQIVKQLFNHNNNQILFRKRPDSAVSSRISPDSPVLHTILIRFLSFAW